jgi:hypothetical protein
LAELGIPCQCRPQHSLDLSGDEMELVEVATMPAAAIGLRAHNLGIGMLDGSGWIQSTKKDAPANEDVSLTNIARAADQNLSLLESAVYAR